MVIENYREKYDNLDEATERIHQLKMALISIVEEPGGRYFEENMKNLAQWVADGIKSRTCGAVSLDPIGFARHVHGWVPLISDEGKHYWNCGQCAREKFMADRDKPTGNRRGMTWGT